MKKKLIFPMVLAILVGLGALAYLLMLPNLPSIERWAMSVLPRSQTPDEQKTLASLQIINDHPLYQITFSG
jgi:hypothetical protein